MDFKICVEISSDEFRKSGFNTILQRCDYILPDYSQGLRNTIEHIRNKEPLASEKRNFILRIYSDLTDIALVYFKVKGGSGNIFKREHLVRDNHYSTLLEQDNITYLLPDDFKIEKTRIEKDKKYYIGEYIENYSCTDCQFG